MVDHFYYNGLARGLDKQPIITGIKYKRVEDDNWVSGKVFDC